ELRQRATQEVVERARQAVLAADTLEPLLMVGAPDFPPGIVGLAAGRLVEEFYRPALVFQEGPTQLRGSARSIPEFDVTAALARCAGLLTRFGGHHKAAGFSAPVTHLEPLRARLLTLAGELLDGVELAPTLTLDAEVDPSALLGVVVALLQRMAPFGEGNRVPAFLARGLEVLDTRPVGDGSHLRLKLREGRATWDAIAFGLGGRAGEARGRLDIAFTLRLPFRYAQGFGSGQALRAANDHPAGHGALELEVLDFRRAQP
ncbi:MAG: hypothetical protein HY688_02920, partial [Chloroflexi bacterium]|nr:hypothetical protein [Chloroflexota bacterium]